MLVVLLVLLVSVLPMTPDDPGPDPVTSTLERAVRVFGEGRRQAGLALADSLAGEHPDVARIHRVRGQLLWYADRRDAAKAAFRRALELDPTDETAIVHLKRLRFVPPDFQPPTMLITDNFVLRPITAADAEKDHAALMSSIEHLQGVFGPGDTWPQGVTLQENREVLGWHEQEFAQRTGFVYTVRSRFQDRCVGCVYIYPSRRTEYHADVLFWVTAEEAARGGDERLDRDVRFWLDNQWPFTSVAYPGRDVGWKEFLGS